MIAGPLAEKISREKRELKFSAFLPLILLWLLALTSRRVAARFSGVPGEGMVKFRVMYGWRSRPKGRYAIALALWLAASPSPM